MPLSISNSKHKASHWIITWIIVATVCVTTLGLYEHYLKKRNFLPSVESNKDLWSWYRGQINNRNNKVVLLGASRSLLGINLNKMKQLLPNYEVVQLSLNAKYPMASLFALADDKDFIGNIIISVNSQSLEKVMFTMQTKHNQYFADESTLYKSLDAFITAYFESKLRLLHPSLGIKDVVDFYDKNNRFKKPFYISTHLDRSIFADYTKTNPEYAAKQVYERKSKNHIKYPAIDADIWLKDTDKINQAITKIQKKGGQVIFVRFPTDKGYWQLDSKYYPRDKYWNRFANQTTAATVHFKDVEGLDKIDLPDTNHIDQRDTEFFTETLINYILDNKYL